MAYNEFTLDMLLRNFLVKIEEVPGLFADFAPMALSDLLQQQLDAYLTLALEISTEKARSEFIIAPILGEILRHFQKRISLFSGMEFNVDMERGLRGVCDYMLSLSPLQLVIQAPVIAVVEAKNENMKSGLGQCIAEMLAAQQFNLERQNPVPIVYGVVTTGSNWRFLGLQDTMVQIDSTEYQIRDVQQIVGILVGMIQSAMDVGIATRL
jgi:hypothetical protein